VRLGASMTLYWNSNLRSVRDRGRKCEQQRYRKTQQAGLLPLQLGWSQQMAHLGWVLV
jgi:hypothetical protein